MAEGYDAFFLNISFHANSYCPPRFVYVVCTCDEEPFAPAVGGGESEYWGSG